MRKSNRNWAERDFPTYLMGEFLKTQVTGLSQNVGEHLQSFFRNLHFVHRARLAIWQKSLLLVVSFNLTQLYRRVPPLPHFCSTAAPLAGEGPLQLCCWWWWWALPGGWPGPAAAAIESSASHPSYCPAIAMHWHSDNALTMHLVTKGWKKWVNELCLGLAALESPAIH